MNTIGGREMERGGRIFVARGIADSIRIKRLRKRLVAPFFVQYLKEVVALYDCLEANNG